MNESIRKRNLRQMQDYLQPKRPPLRKRVWAQSLTEVLGISILPRVLLMLKRNSVLAQSMRNMLVFHHPNPLQERGPKWVLGVVPSLYFVKAMTKLFSMGWESPTLAPIHQVSQRCLLKGLRNLLLSTKPKDLHLNLAIPGLHPWAHHTIRLRVLVSDSQAATPVWFLGNPAQEEKVGPSLILALCPGARMAALAQVLSDQSLGPRGQPVTSVPLDGQSVVQLALDDL